MKGLPVLRCRSLSGFAAMMAACAVIIIISEVDAKVPVNLSVQSRYAAFIRDSECSSVVVLRGGAADVLGEEEDDEYDYEEDEEIEEEEEKLAASAMKATRKARAKKTATAKKAVNAKLSKKKSKSSILKLLRVPYIIRASMNPFTFIAMTKAYFSSLFNPSYLKENKDQSQELRSALEEKAKKSGPSGGSRKGKRSMKPGQAVTLSDLPQLNT